MIRLVRPTEALKEQALEFKQEFLITGNSSLTEVNCLIKWMITENGADP